MAGPMVMDPGCFTDAAFAAWERSVVFRNAWLAGPRAPEPGVRVPFEALGEPFWTVNDDGLRTFPNACTHAWHTLVTAPSAGKAVVCGQHGRRFDRLGRCLGQPGLEEIHETDHLPAFETIAWGPLIFFCRGDTSPIAETLSIVDDQLPRPITDLASASFDETRIVAGNWKLHACNYLDQLHLPFVHRESLSKTIDLSTYEQTIYDDAVLQTALAKDSKLALPGTDLFAQWWFLWPCTALNFYPWGLSLNIYEPGPTPDQTRFVWRRYVWDDAAASRMEDWSITGADAEDVDAIQNVASGLRSSDVRPVRFLPGEEAVAWFHERMAATEERWPQKP